jgi:hypothetical protein
MKKYGKNRVKFAKFRHRSAAFLKKWLIGSKNHVDMPKNLGVFSLHGAKKPFLKKATLFCVRIWLILPYFLAIFSYLKFIFSP